MNLTKRSRRGHKVITTTANRCVIFFSLYQRATTLACSAISVAASARRLRVSSSTTRRTRLVAHTTRTRWTRLTATIRGCVCRQSKREKRRLGRKREKKKRKCCPWSRKTRTSGELIVTNLYIYIYIRTYFKSSIIGRHSGS